MDVAGYWNPGTAVGVFFVLACLPGVFWPRQMWRLSLLGKRWWFAEPDRLNPSRAALTTVRGACALGMIAGGVFLALGVREATWVDTEYGTPGWEARQLDQQVRGLASASAGDPRDPELAATAADRTRSALATYLCRPGPPATPKEGRDLCVTSETLLLEQVGHIDLASDYAGTGRITIRPHPRGSRAKAACLVVAADPGDEGVVRPGPCPSS